MPRVKEIGTVIAQRELVFVADDGSRTSTVLRVGMPYEHGEGFDWCCPYEIESGLIKKTFGLFGIDSLQALQLTIKTLPAELEYWERKNQGKFFFLDEEGSGV